jgi:hypothetical protein
MFWVKSPDGGIVNLGLAEQVTISKNGRGLCVVACFAGEQTVTIFRGDDKKCAEYISHLFEQLRTERLKSEQLHY